MEERQELSSSVVDAVSLEQALRDAEVANIRAIELTRALLEREERIAKLQGELVQLKRAMDPRRRAEHVFRKNHTLYVVARRAKRMMGR
ncbi:MAG: hypothetical protein ACTHON_13055 [Humibacter sp.]